MVFRLKYIASNTGNPLLWTSLWHLGNGSIVTMHVSQQKRSLSMTGTWKRKMIAFTIKFSWYRPVYNMWLSGPSGNMVFLLEAIDYSFQPAKSSLQLNIFAGCQLFNTSLINLENFMNFVTNQRFRYYFWPCTHSKKYLICNWLK